MGIPLNRRDFLGATALGVGVGLSGCQSQPAVPRRVLGKTSESVSSLAFGGGSRFLMYEDEQEALQILNEAIDSGINYLDTAIAYGDGKSEERYGKILKQRRPEVFVATKLPYRTHDEAMEGIEASLGRLQTDHVDLLHIHSLERMEDLEAIEKPDGVLKALYRIREEGMARYIGMTSHTDAVTLKTAIERHDLDCVQMALNPATKSGYATGFEEITLPVALRKNLGIVAMKITGQEQLVGDSEGKTSMRDLLHYALSLPVATCVVGMPRPEFLRENIELTRGFVPLTEAQKERVRARVATSVAAFHHFLQHHSDTGCRSRV